MPYTNCDCCGWYHFHPLLHCHGGGKFFVLSHIREQPNAVLKLGKWVESNVHQNAMLNKQAEKQMGNAYSANFHWTTNFSGSSVLALDWIFPHTDYPFLVHIPTFSFALRLSPFVVLFLAISLRYHIRTLNAKKEWKQKQIAYAFFQMRMHTYSYFQKACLSVCFNHDPTFHFPYSARIHFFCSHIPSFHVKWDIYWKSNANWISTD